MERKLSGSSSIRSGLKEDAPTGATSRRLRPGPRLLVLLAGISLVALIAIIVLTRDVRSLSFHGPDLALWRAQSPVIQAHAGAAILALLTGAFLLLRRKGDGLHRSLGWFWVVTMAATAASSFFILEINKGSFSLIHGLSAYTLIALPLAVLAARRGDIRSHRSAMMTLFTAALIVAGLFTFLPGRLMWRLFFS